jgi:hypothetical protein
MLGPGRLAAELLGPELLGPGVFWSFIFLRSWADIVPFAWSGTGPVGHATQSDQRNQVSQIR